MILLAIDPGPTETAWAFVQSDGRLALWREVTYDDVDIRFGKEANGVFLEKVLNHAADWQFPVVIEKVEHYGKDMHAGQTTFETCRWSGRFEQFYIDHGGKSDGWHRVPRRLVKQTLLGMGAAKDKDIRTAVIDRLGAPGKKTVPGPTYGVGKDVWQAIGLGLVWLDLNLKGGG